MKRAYQKPTLEVESFTITQQITSCAGTKIGFSNAACVEKDPDATLQMKAFAQDGWFMGGCDVTAYDTGKENGICYHTNANLAFTS